jgi:hypothetical protein
MIERVTTPAIASTTATATSALLTGYIEHIRLQVRVAAGTTSSNTVTVTITDSDLGRTILTVAGISGLSNQYPIKVQSKGAADGAAITGEYEKMYLHSQRLTIAVTSGTNTDYVEAFILVSP